MELLLAFFLVSGEASAIPFIISFMKSSFLLLPNFFDETGL
tara:strand:+ start:375 stop:497 length:123 start_codon:yes stop_codon:yes gene_type:complete